MSDDEIPKLADWLDEYRSRPRPIEVIVASWDLAEPVPDDPSEGLSAGQVGIAVVRYDAPGWPGPPDNSHYVMGLDAKGQQLWDDWYESEEAARRAIDAGEYGRVTVRGRERG